MDKTSTRRSMARLRKRLMQGAVIALLVIGVVWLVLGVVENASLSDFQGIPWKK